MKRVLLAPGGDREATLRALEGPFETLKTSRKAHVRRAGPWVIKEAPGPEGSAVRYALSGLRARRAWRSALRLSERDVPIPAPAAFVEWTVLGVPVRSAMISAYLEGWSNVEDHSRAIPLTEAPAALDRLAAAVERLMEAGVYHADLSGKNIFTNGVVCAFIDLDACVPGARWTGKRRMKMLVQLYDSFCDRWDDGILEPFLERLGAGPLGGIAAVRRGQGRRRARVEAKWRAQAARSKDR